MPHSRLRNAIRLAEVKAEVDRALFRVWVLVILILEYAGDEQARDQR